MGMQDAVILPNDPDESNQVVPKPTDVENEILRRNNKNQELLIQELRGQISGFAEKLAGLETTILSYKKMWENQASTITELQERIRVKDIAIQAANDCIDHMNKKDRMFIKLLDDQFQKSIED